MTPRLRYSSIIEDPDPTMIIGNPPAKELEHVWGFFIEQSRRRRFHDPLIKQIKQQPLFELMTVLVLEKHGIEKIFEHLRPC